MLITATYIWSWIVFNGHFEPSFANLDHCEQMTGSFSALLHACNLSDGTNTCYMATIFHSIPTCIVLRYSITSMLIEIYNFTESIMPLLPCVVIKQGINFNISMKVFLCYQDLTAEGHFNIGLPIIS